MKMMIAVMMTIIMTVMTMRITHIYYVSAVLPYWPRPEAPTLAEGSNHDQK